MLIKQNVEKTLSPNIITTCIILLCFYENFLCKILVQNWEWDDTVKHIHVHCWGTNSFDS